MSVFWRVSFRSPTPRYAFIKEFTLPWQNARSWKSGIQLFFTLGNLDIIDYLLHDSIISTIPYLLILLLGDNVFDCWDDYTQNFLQWSFCIPMRDPEQYREREIQFLARNLDIMDYLLPNSTNPTKMIPYSVVFLLCDNIFGCWEDYTQKSTCKL